MGKYYEMHIQYPKDNPEFMNSVKDYIHMDSWGYSLRMGIKGYRTEEKVERIEHFIRPDEYIKKQIKVEFSIPIMCEIFDDGSCVDVITGTRYAKYIQYSSENELTPSLELIRLRELSGSEVMNILKSLSPEQIASYKKGIIQVDYAIRRAYNAKMAKENQIDNYIRSFKNNNGK